MLNKKRGLAPIIATLLIVVITITAIGILWAVINPIIRTQSEEAQTGIDLLKQQIEITRAEYLIPDKIILTIRNPSSSKFDGYQIVVDNGTHSFPYKIDESIGAYQTKTFSFITPRHLVLNPSFVSVSTIMRNRQGNPIKKPLETKKDAGLISYWKFDEGSGNTATDINGKNDGLIYGATWKSGADCIAGSCLSFNGGAGDYVDFGNDSSLDITNAFTIAVWIKLNTILWDRNIVAKWNPEQYILKVESDDNSIKLVTFDGTAYHTAQTPANSALIGEWMYLVGTYDGNILRMYIDGVQTGTTPSAPNPRSTNSKVYIGKLEGSTSSINGTIDEVRIYNRSLSEEEILNNWEKTNVGRNFPTCHDNPNHLIYYGYYGVLPTPLTSVNNYTNTIVLVGATELDYINNASDLGLKTILLWGLPSNKNIWDSKLSDLDEKLRQKNIDSDKILALYIIDEPRIGKGWNNSLLDEAVLKTKEYFPDKKIMIVFNKGAINDGFIPPQNLDFVGIDPYFYPYSTNGCVQKEKYDGRVIPIVSWAKSFNKSIILIGQSHQIEQPLPFLPMPSVCQQNWYYETAKSELQIEGLLWFKYGNHSRSTENLTGANAFPDIIALHKQIGSCFR
jgi:flagellin-like protein